MEKAGLVGLAMLVAGACASPSPLSQLDERCPNSSVRCVLQDRVSHYLIEVPCEGLGRKEIPQRFSVLKGCQGEPVLYSNFDRVSY